MKERPSAGQVVPARYIESNLGSQKLQLDELDKQEKALQDELHRKVLEAGADEERIKSLGSEYYPRIEAIHAQQRALENDVYEIDDDV